MIAASFHSPTLDANFLREPDRTSCGYCIANPVMCLPPDMNRLEPCVPDLICGLRLAFIDPPQPALRVPKAPFLHPCDPQGQQPHT
jgi:hypothetical protein